MFVGHCSSTYTGVILLLLTPELQIMEMGERGRRISPPVLSVSLLSLLLTEFPYRIAKGTGNGGLLQIMQDVYCASKSIRVDCASGNRSPTVAPQSSLSDRFHLLKIFFLSTRAVTVFVVGERQGKGLLVCADGYMSYGTEQTNQRDMHSRFYFPICEVHTGLHIPVKENIKNHPLSLENC